jgi:tape measure domain-containing protein
MALTWTLRLKDAISGAAGRIASSLGRVNAALRGTQRESAAADRALGGAGKGAAASSKKLGEGFTVAKGLAVNALSAIAAKLAQVGAMAAVQLGGIVKGAMEKGAIMRGLGLLTGGAAGAEKAFGLVSAKANELGMSTLAAAKQVQSLLAGGFKLEGGTGALRVLEAAQALRVINPSANIDNVITALSQIQAKGKLTAEELHGQLGDAGVNIGEVYAQLATKMGKSTDEVRKLMAAGKITSDMGIEAVFASIEKQGGGSLAKIAASGKGSFGNMLERLMSLPGEIGSKLDLGKFFESASGAIDTIITRLTDPKAMAFFDSLFNTQGAGIIESLGKAFGKVMDVMTDPRMVKSMEGLAESIGGMIEGFGEGFGAVAEVMLGMDAGNADDMTAAWRGIGMAIGGVVASIVMLGKVGQILWEFITTVGDGMIAAQNALWSFVGSIFEVGAAAAMAFLALPVLVSDAITGAVASALSGGESIGSNLISGLLSGITGGAASVANAVKDTVLGAIGAGNSVSKTASPSRVFREMGGFFTEGMAIGVRDNAGLVSAETAAATARAAAAGQFVRSSVSATNDNSRTVSIGQMNVSGGGNGDPRAVGRAVAAELRGMVASHG